MQAAEGRYQLTAMLYWASLFSFVLITIWRRFPAWLNLAQLVVLMINCSSLPFLPTLWTVYAAQADYNRRACTAVTHGKYGAAEVHQLDGLTNDAEEVERAAKLLRQAWTN
jgi:hypothetical protein